MKNRLAQESSPYLQQHAENPVDWYPWGTEALEAAVEANKPILLSVGYSACHWCHVMAHESFESPELAAKMNELFINVKVDREERPDIDSLYMEAVHAMTGQGGWPMTVIMTPAGQPFFAGTYFPPVRRHGLPGFGEVLDALGNAWALDNEKVVEQAEYITDALRDNARLEPSATELHRGLVSQASAALVEVHDSVHGGFGNAPKFPAASAIDVLFRHHVSTGDADSLGVATLTLDHMAAGGMFDHLGGGFARYSTDQFWLVPHFEKMLYDNAQLIPAYLHGWQLTGTDGYLQVVKETIEYVCGTLTLDGGAFASAEDADTEGEEGRFYVWTHDELASILTGDEMAIAEDWYGVTRDGNFEGGTNVLFRPEVGALLRPEPVEAVRQKLYDARFRRVRPGIDDKVLTEWNALMIAALAEAGAATDQATWIEAAVDAMEFLEAHLLGASRWYRSWQQRGGRKHLAYAADYAALIDAYTRLGEATGQSRWHHAALETSDNMVELFWDDEVGGVFTTGSDAQELLVQRKELFDSPIPSANANAAFALLRVAAIHDRPDLALRSQEILKLLGDGAARNPQAHARMIAALDLALGSTSEIVLTGDRSDLLAEVRRRYLPNSVVVHGERFDSALWVDRSGEQAYVCKNFTCGLPANDLAELRRQLDALTDR